MSDSINKKKEWALKSGFPFENEALARIYSALPNARIVRNSEFTCKNEDGDHTIRSLDFVAVLSKKTKNIPIRNWPIADTESTNVVFLIDCKYSTDEHFLFTPNFSGVEAKDRKWPFLIPVLKKDSFGVDANIFRKELLQFAEIDTSFSLAGTGRKVKEQSRERDSLASALMQVLQGLYNIINKDSKTLGVTGKDDNYERSAYFYVPIVVTNTPLLLLKKDITIDKITSAQREEDLFEVVDSVLVDTPDIFDLWAEWAKFITETLPKTSSFVNFKWREIPLTHNQVLFCNLEGFSKFLTAQKVKLDGLTVEP